MGAVAAQSIGVSTGVAAARYQLQTYLRGWRWARAALARTEARQREFVAQTGYGDVLRGLPGFGPVEVATLLGWLGDLTRFADPRQAVKMAGLNLTQQRAGHHQGATHISKRGQPALRCALDQAAVVAIAKDAGWRAWYQRLVQRAENLLPRKAARIAVACQRLRVAWACARQQTPFDAQRFAQALGVAG